MPTQLTAAPGAVATRKNPTAGEEQAKSRTPGETTYKHCTTSEYASCLSDHAWDPEVIWQQSTARWHAAKYLSGGFYHQCIVKWWKMTAAAEMYLFVYRCTKALVHMISYIHRFGLHIFRKSNAVPLPALTNAKLNYILLFCFTRTQFFLCFEAFFFLSLTQPQAAVLYYNSIPMHATHLPVHAYTYISQQWRSNTLSSLISEAALL